VPDLAKILELAGPKVVWLFLACVVMRWPNARGLIALHDIGPSAPAIIDVVGILSGAFTLGWLVEAIYRWRARRADSKRHQREARQFLQNLTPSEAELLRYLLRTNQRSIADQFNTTRQVLVHKELGNDPDWWVFSVPDVVWEEMRARWPEECRPTKK
jgi:Super-infection exclusion protein B